MTNCCTTNKSVSSKSSNPHLSTSFLSLFKIIVQENIPHRRLDQLLKSIWAICKKNGHVPDVIPHKSSSFIIWAFFLPSQTWAFLFLHLSSLITIFNPDFCMSQKVSNNYTKFRISLKCVLANYIFFCQCDASSRLIYSSWLRALHVSFLIFSKVLTNEVCGIKKALIHEVFIQL